MRLKIVLTQSHLRNTGKRPAAIIRAAIVVFALGFISCAAEDPDIGIQDIALRWITIERSLARARLAPDAATADDEHRAIIQALGEFHELALSFVDSRAYRTYRAVAPPPGLGIAVADAAADAVPEIHRLADLTLSLRQAALDGDWDAAALVSSDISGAILHTTAWGRAANQAAARMYSWLLFALAVFIALAVFAMRFFHRLMTQTRGGRLRLFASRSLGAGGGKDAHLPGTPRHRGAGNAPPFRGHRQNRQGR